MNFDWVDLKKYGPPDETGMYRVYLCAFGDGTIETATYHGPTDDFWTGGYITHWCIIKDDWHPDYDPSPETQEEVTRIGGWG